MISPISSSPNPYTAHPSTPKVPHPPAKTAAREDSVHLSSQDKSAKDADHDGDSH